jgi:hypothetical protein
MTRWNTCAPNSRNPRNSKKAWLLLAAATMAVLLTGIGVGAITTRRLFTRLPSLMMTERRRPAGTGTVAGTAAVADTADLGGHDV